MSQDKEAKYQYNYKEVATLDFSIHEHPIDIEKLFEKIRLDFGTSYKFSPEKEQVSFNLEIQATSEIVEEEDTKELECFHIRLRNFFNVVDLQRHIDENKIKEDESFLVLIASLSYSTARGILDEKLSGSRYGKNFFLPVIDPKHFVKSEKKEDLQ